MRRGRLDRMTPDPLRDVDDELAFHMQMKREELLAAGVAEEEVEARIADEFGDAHRIERELKEIGRRRLRRWRRSNLVDDVRVDVRQAVRSFARRPAMPAVIVLTLGVVIGAATAVFSLLDAVLLNPLAVRDASGLMTVAEGEQGMPLSYPMSRLLRERSRTADGIAGHMSMSVAVRVGDTAEQIDAALVTGTYFPTLGLTPAGGRLLGPADEAAPGETPHAVISHRMWQRMFGGRDVVGGTLVINEAPFTIVGVAPPRFRGTSLALPVDVWVPITMVATVGRSGLYALPEALTTWQFSMLDHFVRVPPTTSAETVLAELRTLHGAVHVEFAEAEPDMEPLVATPLTEAAAARSREDLVRFLTMLGAAVAIALAVACLNVANLLLLRSTNRAREMSIRAAVGATRMRVTRALLSESLLLGLAAGALGAVIALAALRGLSAFTLPGGIALAELGLRIDTRVLGFAAALSLLCAVSFGVAPAFRTGRGDVMAVLRGGGMEERGAWRGGPALVAVQVALSIVLLVAGSLFVRSLQEALSVEVGFRSEGVAALSVGLRQHGYTAEQAAVFVRDVLDNAARRPGMEHVAASSSIPLERPIRFPVTPGTVSRFGEGEPVAVVSATPGYVDMLDLELVRGRDITWNDDGDGERVALVTEEAARRLWPDQDALGRPLIVMFGQPYHVVGIIRDAHLTRLTDREPHVILPMLQSLNLAAMGRMRLAAAGFDASASLDALRGAVRETDARLPTFQERSLEQHVSAVLMPQRFGALLLGVFAAIALLIAGVGIYTVAAYDVARRRRELGIRAALGAGRRELVHGVVSRSGIAICAGAVTGLALAAYSAQLLRGLLFGIAPYEPVSYAAAAAVLALIAVGATWLPARRAASIDPLDVIRE